MSTSGYFWFHIMYMLLWYSTMLNVLAFLCVCYSLSIQETEGSHGDDDSIGTGSMWISLWHTGSSNWMQHLNKELNNIDISLKQAISQKSLTLLTMSIGLLLLRKLAKTDLKLILYRCLWKVLVLGGWVIKMFILIHTQRTIAETTFHFLLLS